MILAKIVEKESGEDKSAETMNRVHVTSKGTSTFICPDCNNTKLVDVSKYVNLNQTVTVNVKCPCGNKFTSSLNKRGQYRRNTDLNGTYSLVAQGNTANVGLMTVCDLSMTGLKLKLKACRDLSIGDLIRVEFYLDDSHRSFIQKKVTIRNIRPPYIGTEFLPREDIGRSLGFYLFFS